MESTVGGKDAAIEPPRMGLWRVDERECSCLVLSVNSIALLGGLVAQQITKK